MIFSIRDLGFELGPFLLEGWLALAARCVCALVIFLAGSLVSLLLRKKICPALRGRTWHFAATPILLRSLEGPLERMAASTLRWPVCRGPSPAFRNSCSQSTRS